MQTDLSPLQTQILSIQTELFKILIVLSTVQTKLSPTAKEDLFTPQVHRRLPQYSTSIWIFCHRKVNSDIYCKKTVCSKMLPTAL